MRESPNAPLTAPYNTAEPIRTLNRATETVARAQVVLSTPAIGLDQVDSGSLFLRKGP